MMGATVGSRGIKRRKPYRKLPPARVPDDDDLVPPHVMWPAAGSGFEANPYSPAGQAQRGWWLAQRLRRGEWPPPRTDWRPLALIAAIPLGLTVLVALAAILAELFR